MKKCTKCGVEKDIKEFYLCKLNKTGLQSYCKDCQKALASIHSKTEKSKATQKRYVINNPEKRWSISSIAGHKRSGYIIKISVKELEHLALSSKFCKYCGIKLDWSVFFKKTIQKNSPTLDRKENEKIITKDNIAIVCHKCNYVKNSGTFEELLEYAERLLKFQKRI